MNAHYLSEKPSKFALDLINYLKTNNNLLEIGFGNGTDLLFFENQGFNVKGIDLSEEFVIKAKSKGLGVIQSSAESLPYLENTFDIIYSKNVLHFTDLNKSIKEIFRVLKPNGLAYLVLILQTKSKNNKIIFELDVEPYLKNKKVIKKKEFIKIDEEGTNNKHTHKLLFCILEK
ncbi:MAG TPA: class I SAM-dependent methyltransferase [Candidatus Nanoarchaeia archaeon]|nr:class I SAM-dependent methyltransferase [Candidatus Nanoarchaeia archaeon]